MTTIWRTVAILPIIPRTNFDFTDDHLNDDHAGKNQDVTPDYRSSQPKWDCLQVCLVFKA